MTCTATHRPAWFGASASEPMAGRLSVHRGSHGRRQQPSPSATGSALSTLRRDGSSSSCYRKRLKLHQCHGFGLR